MPQMLIDIDDEFIDWEGWARKRFASAGIHIESADLAGAADLPNADRAETPADEPADPWARPTTGGAPTGSTTPSATPSATTTTNGRPSVPPKDSYKYRDDRGNNHEFNKAGAPPCEHGQPAVYVTGTGKTGKPWKQWRCALSSTDRWSDKCELSQWA